MEALNLFNNGLSYSQIGKLMGKSKSAVAGMIHRQRDPSYQPREPKGTRANDLWTEERLTERWADRKKRRA